MATITCADCETVLDEAADGEPRQPCPRCGSRLRNIAVEIEERVEIREMLGVEGRRQGTKKFAFQDRSGDEFGVKVQRWLKKVRVIDRESDQYREKVWDPETGEVIHECEEPLSQHFGHGSAKKPSSGRKPTN
jgi:phage FluMu protein Com